MRATRRSGPSVSLCRPAACRSYLRTMSDTADLMLIENFR